MYNKINLPNGVRVVSESISTVRSVSVGIWVKNGSRYEPRELAGMSHFIEHMIFKGTQSRTAAEIAMEMDAIGGQVNAFTTKECTCYYLKTLDSHLKTGVSILADMFFNSKFDEKDVELERSVILEEIGMYEDSPEDVATEKLFEACFDNYSLGRPILGTPETLKNITGEKMHSFMREYYRPEDTVVSISGHFEQDDIDMICKLFSVMYGTGKNQIETAQYSKSVVVRPKEIEQNHICIGFPGVSILSDERYTYQILNGILGGGMSSRLFQTVREQNGLCYSVYSFLTSHEEIGMFNIYTALNKSMEQKAVELIRTVCEDFCKNGPTEQELLRSREQVKTNILMGLESTSARMNQIAKGELFFGKATELDELIARYDAVTIDGVMKLACRILDFNNASICAVGKTDTKERYESYLKSVSK